MSVKVKIVADESGKIVLDVVEFGGVPLIITIEEEDKPRLIYERNFYRARLLEDYVSILFEKSGKIIDPKVAHERFKYQCNPVLVGGEIVGGTTSEFSANEHQMYNERCKRYLMAISDIKY